MASNSPESARRLAVSGNSKAPGTQATVIEASSRPWRRSAESAPSRSDFVMVSLNRLASRAMRRPLASSRPSYVGIVGFLQVDVLGSVPGALRSQLLELIRVGIEHEMVAELGCLGLEIIDVLHVGHRLQRHPFDDLEVVARQPAVLGGVVGHQPHGGDAEVDEDLGADAVLAGVGGEAELQVGLHRVAPLLLELVGPQLVAD